MFETRQQYNVHVKNNSVQRLNIAVKAIQSCYSEKKQRFSVIKNKTFGFLGIYLCQYNSKFLRISTLLSNRFYLPLVKLIYLSVQIRLSSFVKYFSQKFCQKYCSPFHIIDSFQSCEKQKDFFPVNNETNYCTGITLDLHTYFIINFLLLNKAHVLFRTNTLSNMNHAGKSIINFFPSSACADWWYFSKIEKNYIACAIAIHL